VYGLTERSVEKSPLLQKTESLPVIRQKFIPWNFANVDGREKPSMFRSQPDLTEDESQELKFHKCFVHNSDDDESECCSDDAHHRFHSHGKNRKQRSLIARLKLLNIRAKMQSIGLPDMEFALTPVPGMVKNGNIYQTTKLVTDDAYFAKLGQFEQKLQKGQVNRKGRYVEGVFVDMKGQNAEAEQLYQVGGASRNHRDQYATSD
jgi:hypothetical protein